MFVRKSKYLEARALAFAWQRKYNELLGQWNDLVDRVNAKGGVALLDGTIAPAQPAPLAPEDIQRLLLLCHPDKHDGKPMAVEMTRKLLALREDADAGRLLGP